MMTAPATAINDEVRVLIDVQIETFGQPAPLTSAQLPEFHDRSETSLNIGAEEVRTAGQKRVLPASIAEMLDRELPTLPQS